MSDTARQTLRMFRAGQTVDQVALERRLTANTIFGHLTEAIENGESLDLGSFFTAEEKREVAAAFKTSGLGSLSVVFEGLGGRYDYNRLRLARAALKAREARAKT